MNDVEYWEQQFGQLSSDEGLSAKREPLPGDEYLEQVWAEEEQVTTPQIDLDHPDQLWALDGLIDGGYLSFVYGSRHSEFGGWFNIKWKYKNFLMVMDHKDSIRRREYPAYKSRRNDRRKNYPQAMETYQKVLEFREILLEDYSVRTISLPRYEADDVIALLFIYGIGTNQVVAQDKDFFQVPGLQSSMFDHTGMCQSYREFKLPKYALEPSTGGSHVLTQALFGDKSDSIPRLLPSNGWHSKALYADLIKDARDLHQAFLNCYSYWGEELIVNLKLVVLPHHSMALLDTEDDDLFLQSLSSGQYWDELNFDSWLLQEIIDNINYYEGE